MSKPLPQQNVPLGSIEKLIGLQGAISSVALSHPEGHDCKVCRASHGDQDALMELYAEMYDREEAA